MQMIFALAGLLVVIGAVNCGENSFDAVVLNSNLFGNAKGEAPGSELWWMSKGKIESIVLT